MVLLLLAHHGKVTKLFNFKALNQMRWCGEVVLILDSKKKRINWSLCLVKKTFCGRDNHIRVVEIKLVIQLLFVQ